MVKDGNRTPDPKTSNYSGAISNESIYILLTHTAVNLTPVKAADITSAYLQAPTSENHYIFYGPEFGIENVGKRSRIVRASYGGKIAGSDSWHHLRSCMDHLGFESSDPIQKSGCGYQFSSMGRLRTMSIYYYMLKTASLSVIDLSP